MEGEGEGAERERRGSGEGEGEEQESAGEERERGGITEGGSREGSWRRRAGIKEQLNSIKKLHVGVFLELQQRKKIIPPHLRSRNSGLFLFWMNNKNKPSGDQKKKTLGTRLKFKKDQKKNPGAKKIPEPKKITQPKNPLYKILDSTLKSVTKKKKRDLPSNNGP
jgi:hypothetical protein